jgi:spermidine synthase
MSWFYEDYENFAKVGLRVDEVLVEEQTQYQKLVICTNKYFGKILLLDDRVMFSEKDEFIYHEMITHMPLCTHANSKKVLVIGGGDGGAVREVLKHAEIEEVVLCEIDERVVELCKEHFPAIAYGLDDSRVEVVYRDGFKYLQEKQNYFDLIITDSTDPIGPAENLFKENYFKVVKKALKPDGIMVSQSESPWIYNDILTNMTKAMCNYYKNVTTYIAMVPLYFPGFWTMTFASDAFSLKEFDQDKSAKIAALCKYYNPEIHHGALALPTFAKEVVCNQSL